MTYGWKGAMSFAFLFFLSCAAFFGLCLTVGMFGHRRNRPRLAIVFLASAALLGRGPYHSALLENRNKVVALMMQKMAMSYLSGPR